MCKIILHNQENSTCKSIILSMLRLMINFEYEVFHGSVMNSVFLEMFYSPLFLHRFQQLLHFFLRHLRSADILTRHLRKGTVVVCVQQFRQLFFDYSIFYLLFVHSTFSILSSESSPYLHKIRQES